MIIQIKCLGRKGPGEPALEVPVDAEVQVGNASGCNTISLNVKCVHNTGGHGQRCKASHPDVDKVGDGVDCPYSLAVPYYHDHKLVGPRVKQYTNNLEPPESSTVWDDRRVLFLYTLSCCYSMSVMYGKVCIIRYNFIYEKTFKKQKILLWYM